MKPRRVLVTPRAQREYREIVDWYRRTLGAKAAVKVARSLQAGIRATTTVSLRHAARADLPEHTYRVVAKAHLVIFHIENDVVKIIRILHGARDAPSALDES